MLPVARAAICGATRVQPPIAAARGERRRCHARVIRRFWCSADDCSLFAMARTIFRHACYWCCLLVPSFFPRVLYHYYYARFFFSMICLLIFIVDISWCCCYLCCRLFCHACFRCSFAAIMLCWYCHACRFYLLFFTLYYAFTLSFCWCWCCSCLLFCRYYCCFFCCRHFSARCSAVRAMLPRSYYAPLHIMPSLRIPCRHCCLPLFDAVFICDAMPRCHYAAYAAAVFRYESLPYLSPHDVIHGTCLLRWLFSMFRWYLLLIFVAAIYILMLDAASPSYFADAFMPRRLPLCARCCRAFTYACHAYFCHTSFSVCRCYLCLCSMPLFDAYYRPSFTLRRFMSAIFDARESAWYYLCAILMIFFSDMFAFCSARRYFSVAYLLYAMFVMIDACLCWRFTFSMPCWCSRRRYADDARFIVEMRWFIVASLMLLLWCESQRTLDARWLCSCLSWFFLRHAMLATVLLIAHMLIAARYGDAAWFSRMRDAHDARAESKSLKDYIHMFMFWCSYAAPWYFRCYYICDAMPIGAFSLRYVVLPVLCRHARWFYYRPLHDALFPSCHYLYFMFSSDIVDIAMMPHFAADAMLLVRDMLPLLRGAARSMTRAMARSAHAHYFYLTFLFAMQDMLCHADACVARAQARMRLRRRAGESALLQRAWGCYYLFHIRDDARHARLMLCWVQRVRVYEVLWEPLCAHACREYARFVAVRCLLRHAE